MRESVRLLGGHPERETDAIRAGVADDDDEEGGEPKMPTCGDYVLHFLTLFWKILFAFVPPTGQTHSTFL